MKTKRRKQPKEHIWKQPYKSLHDQLKKHKPIWINCIKLVNGERQ